MSFEIKLPASNMDLLLMMLSRFRDPMHYALSSFFIDEVRACLVT